MGLLGSLIERGDDHREVWKILGVARPVSRTDIVAADLYPDAVECLRAAKAAGLGVGIAGNQPRGAVEALMSLNVSADFVASSAEWGVAKPAPEFFAQVARAARVQPHEILYVGDRLDNDVVPAAAAGMRTALLRRGPWGYVHARRPESKAADLLLDSLVELTSALQHYRR